jgi:hypothetical protein
MTLAFENGQVPPELRELILGGHCTVFIGSGPSSGVYGAWFDVVNHLSESCGIARSLSNASTPEELLAAAQEAKAANGTAYYGFLGHHFGRPADLAPFLYDTLLSLPFATYLTVNLDPTLAMKAGRLSDPLPIHAYPTLDRRAMSKRSVHHLHGLVVEGTVPAAGSVVLAQEEFAEAYADTSPLMHLMLPTLENDPLLFVGCGLREPTMSRVFGICKDHQQARLRLVAASGQAPTHPPPRFILLRRPVIVDELGAPIVEQSNLKMQSEERYYKGLDVEPVWYDGTGDDHSSLRRAFEQLAKIRSPAVGHGWQEVVHGD